MVRPLWGGGGGGGGGGGELDGLSITRINILDAGNCSNHTFDLSSPVAFLTVISEIQRIYRARGS